MVDAIGFEPTTPTMSRCQTQCGYSTVFRAFGEHFIS